MRLHPASAPITAIASNAAQQATGRVKKPVSRTDSFPSHERKRVSSRGRMSVADELFSRSPADGRHQRAVDREPASGDVWGVARRWS